MMLISRRSRMAGAIAAGVLIACATLAAAQSRKPSQGPVKAVPFQAPLPELKINLTAASSYCTAEGKANVSLIVRMVNAGQGIADFTKAPLQVVLAVQSWWILPPDGKAKPASAVVLLPQIGHPLVLLAGQEWTTDFMVLGLPKLTGPKQSKYGFTFKVDPSNSVKESDEGNNIGTVGEPDPCFKK